MTKKSLGQYYTLANPFGHPLFNEWMSLVCLGNTTPRVVEPFAGANNIVRLMREAGHTCEWGCFDIEPSKDNAVPEFPITVRDTLKDFPVGYGVCVTNPPYLAKNSARRMGVPYEWQDDDLYLACLRKMLANCGYVACIIPESFITTGAHMDRLYGIVSLAYKMFDDTECPVCLAMFTPQRCDCIRVYSNDVYLGTLSELTSNTILKENSYHRWMFNDPYGSIGVKAVDSTNGDLCCFIEGDKITPDDVKSSSRSITRVSGLPEHIDVCDFINRCNDALGEFRRSTKDVTLTSFKGMTKQGRYRRRLDYNTIRCILNYCLRCYTTPLF